MKHNILINGYSLVDEKIDTKTVVSDQMLKVHTRRIASSGSTPIIRSIFGTMINQFCHIFESYSKDGITK